MEDQQIIHLFFSRDEQAITETDHKYGKLCRQISTNVLSNHEDSEECVSDAYLALWNQIPPVKPGNFCAFLCKITRNLSLKKADYLNAQKRSIHATLSLDELEDSFSFRECAYSSGIDETTLSSTLSEQISNFLRSEKPDSRYVFMRKYWFFDSVSEIAERCHFSEEKVKSMLFRTRTRLKNYLIKINE